MRDADRQGSRGNTHLFVSYLFGFCVRLLHQNYECIIVRELKEYESCAALRRVSPAPHFGECGAWGREFFIDDPLV